MNNYCEACAEVSAILKLLNKEEYNKIPVEVIEAIETSANHKYKFDKNIDLKEQNLMEETKAILYNLYRDYLCTEEQREYIKKQQLKDRQIEEIRKKEMYNSKELFNKNKKKYEI